MPIAFALLLLGIGLALFDDDNKPEDKGGKSTPAAKKTDEASKVKAAKAKAEPEPS